MELEGELATEDLFATLYKDDSGGPFKLTKGQVEIADCVLRRQYPRVRIMTPTRYGKSRVLAMALITRCALNAEKWAIIAPTFRKAKIIMGYALQHALQNPLTRQALQLDPDEDLDRLRRERSRQKLTFKVPNGLGELFILSAEGHRVAGKGEALMGYGASNIVLDESSLIDDITYATVKRMLGDAIGGDSVLIEVGNPFRRNHFYRIGKYPEYHKIFIDWQKAVEENHPTLVLTFVDEAKREALFDILYECKFPEEDAVDDAGWSSLLTLTDIERAKERGRDIRPLGTKRLGFDVADGGDCWNVWSLRDDLLLSILRKDHDKSTMSSCGRTLALREEHEVTPAYVTIDRTGVGAGAVDRCWEQGIGVNGFIAGEDADNFDKFCNRRAECYWRFREWILNGGALSDDDEWDVLSEIKWRVHSDKRIQIMSKEEMRKRGINGFDAPDSGMLTFALPNSDKPTVRMSLEAQQFEKELRQRNSGVLADI